MLEDMNWEIEIKILKFELNLSPNYNKRFAKINN